MARKFFVGGNFKMNGTKASLDKIIDTLNEAKLNPDVGGWCGPQLVPQSRRLFF
jgi:triosephosphate isomerase